MLGNFQKGALEHAQQAISAAQKAFPSWSATDYRERAALFRKAAELFSKEKFRLAAILSYENAKSRYESIGEVDEAIDFMRYYSSELEANKGYERRTSVLQSSAKVSTGFQGAPSGTEKIQDSDEALWCIWGHSTVQLSRIHLRGHECRGNDNGQHSGVQAVID